MDSAFGWITLIVESIGSGCLYMMWDNDLAWKETSGAKFVWWVIGGFIIICHFCLILAGLCIFIIRPFDAFSAFLFLPIILLLALVWVTTLAALITTMDYLNRSKD